MDTSEAKQMPAMSDMLITIMSFLVWAESDDAVYGGNTATEALEMFRLMLGYDVETFQKLKDVVLNN